MMEKMGSVSVIEHTILSTKKDFRLDWFSGKGAGGQYRNKHQNCCRITHIPTGMVETGQSHRERPANQREAFQKLAKRVVDHYSKEELRERYGSVERVRTYNEPDNRVVDHASGLQAQYSEIVGKNDLEPMITARAHAKNTS